MAQICLTGIDHSKSGKLPEPGKAHLVVSSVTDRDGRYSVICEVAAHEKEDQVGRIMPISLQLGGKGAKRAVDFAISTGVLDPDDYNASVAAGVPAIDVPLENAVGRSFCTILAYGKGEYSDRVDVGFKFVDPTSPEADRYPRDKSILETEPDTSVAESVAF